MDRLLELIFENPGKAFTVREISQKTRIPKSTVQRYLQQLKKSKMLKKNNELLVDAYTKFLKSFFMIKKIIESGLIAHLEKTFTPSAIILFGSARKGEYTKESDIDVFVETTKKQEIDLVTFEKKLKHNIQLFKESSIQNLPNELFNNIMNGIKLSGYIKLK